MIGAVRVALEGGGEVDGRHDGAGERVAVASGVDGDGLDVGGTVRNSWLYRRSSSQARISAAGTSTLLAGHQVFGGYDAGFDFPWADEQGVPNAPFFRIFELFAVAVQIRVEIDPQPALAQAGRQLQRRADGVGVELGHQHLGLTGQPRREEAAAPP